MDTVTPIATVEAHIRRGGFNYAHFGVVGEFEELIPALTEEFAKLKG
jgi:electron transfer flavoprotein alpha subunit